MRRRNRYQSGIGFLDLLFNGWLIFVFLFIVSFVLIVPERKDASITTKAEFVITLTWDDHSSDDVDIWVEDPAGNLIYYNQKEKGLMHLDRDDLGKQKDVVHLPSGATIDYLHNQEIVTIRGFIPGEWTVNVHMYSKKDATTTNVEVRMVKLNPSTNIIFQRRLKMAEYWEEVTIARFQMNETGEIFSIDNTPKKLILSEKAGVMITPSGGTSEDYYSGDQSGGF